MSNSLNVVFRRVNFIGFVSKDELGRVKCLTEWAAEKFPGFSVQAGNVYKGLVRSRVLISVSYLEFADVDMRNFVLKEVKSKSLQCKFENSLIAIKPALSQMVRDRIWAFNTAYDLVKKSSLANGKTVERTNDKEKRVITVDGQVAFDQSGVDGLDSFVGGFSGLSLPGKS